MVIVVKKPYMGGTHRKKPRLTLTCEWSGCYRDTRKNIRPKEKKLKLTGTKKCDSSFLLKAKKLDTNDDWTLIVICGMHNHPAAVCLEGHSYARRLSHKETSLLVDMSNSNVQPRELLVTLKQRNSENVSTMKTIYNARQRHKVFEKAWRSEMQLLLGQLAVNKYIE